MISALVLAGGKATRLGGVDKRELVVEGRTIFERQCAVLVPRVTEVIVSSPRDVAGFRTVRDAIADAGPLAGIAAGLGVATTPWLLVVAGDMPDLSGALIDLVVSQIADEVDAVGIRIGGLPEPLVCALHARCAPVVRGGLPRASARRRGCSPTATSGSPGSRRRRCGPSIRRSRR